MHGENPRYCTWCGCATITSVKELCIIPKINRDRSIGYFINGLFIPGSMTKEIKHERFSSRGQNGSKAPTPWRGHCGFCNEHRGKSGDRSIYSISSTSQDIQRNFAGLLMSPRNTRRLHFHGYLAFG